MDAIDASLKRLGMEYVDLYQIHRWDYETPIEETMEALHDVVKAGKARYIGVSSMYAWQFAKAQHVAEANGWTPFVSMQNHWNAVYREEEREMVPLCIDQGVGCMPWSPLARGFLAGNRRKLGSGETKRARTTLTSRNCTIATEISACWMPSNRRSRLLTGRIRCSDTTECVLNRTTVQSYSMTSGGFSNASE
jgi:aryl-alcohol dehydrogenase-like predicted oxidoreductase